MILITVLIEIILIILMIIMLCWAEETMDGWKDVAGCIIFIVVIALPILLSVFHGYVDYKESEDKDKARITAVTQEQTAFRVYYKVEVEYLTNTPTQEGIVINKNIEKDTFYCYYEDKELVEKLKNNMYKELWIISGYRGGYETYKDFGTRLIKDIKLIEDI